MDEINFPFKDTLQFCCPDTEIEFNRLLEKLKELGFKKFDNKNKVNFDLSYFIWVNERYPDVPSLSGGVRYATSSLYRDLNQIGGLQINYLEPYNERIVFELLDEMYSAIGLEIKKIKMEIYI